MCGGYFLNQTPSAIMVGAIIRAIDEPLAPIRCASVTAYAPCADCRDVAGCAIRKAMVEVRNVVAEILDRKPLAALCRAGRDNTADRIVI